jgi:hypothetical protein
MTAVFHISASHTSTSGGRGNYTTTMCLEVNYWGSEGPTHIPSDPQLLFAEEVEDVTCEDCILARLGNLP